MKANHDIRADMPENRDRFSAPFFSRFELKPAPQALRLNEKVEKRYPFPTFYSDVTCAIGIFMCDYERAKAMLPHPGMKPVRMPKCRALVAFSCYEYRNVMQVWPYNEISMMIPVLFEPKLDVPVLPMVAGRLFGSLGYYVFHMPVTSKENQIRGNRLWGLPKVTQDIDVRNDGGDCVTTAYEADGSPYFELRVPRAGSAVEFDERANVYSKLEGKYLVSRTSFQARFNVNKNMGLLFKKNVQPDRTYLTLGRGPGAQVLRNLEIEPAPFQLRYAEGMNAAFDLAHAQREGNA